MYRWWSFAVVMLLAGSWSMADEKEKTRNPFNVKDVSDPDGKDVKEFAEKAKLSGDDKDDNAARWSDRTTSGKKGSLDGEWPSRWNGGSAGGKWVSGMATVKTIGDRVYILYKDEGGTYLIDAKREGKNRLVGRYQSQETASDTSPWVGLIVDNERIDGVWGEGRWDLRRKIEEKKKPE